MMANGHEIIPRQWLIDATTVLSSDTHLAPGVATKYYSYGNQIWLLPGAERRFVLLGIRGQMIFVAPATKVVYIPQCVRNQSIRLARVHVPSDRCDGGNSPERGDDLGITDVAAVNDVVDMSRRYSAKERGLATKSWVSCHFKLAARNLFRARQLAWDRRDQSSAAANKDREDNVP